MANSFSGKLKGGKYKQKLHFVPCADKEEPKVGHEISEAAIFRFLLNEEKMGKFDEAEVEIPEMLEILKDIEKKSKITQVEVYRNSMNPVTDAMKAFHVFIVFKSTSETADDRVYWWSLEKNTEYIVLQRSCNKENVKDKLEGKKRTKVKLIEKDLKGKGTIQDLFAILWAHQMISENYHILNSNCQSLVTFVGQQITEIGYEYKGNFKYYPPRESGRDKQMLDLINILRGSSDWPPLFILIQMGNIDIFDKIVASGKYNINASYSYNEMTPLHLAITLQKTNMVEHLLKHPLNADLTTRNATGKSALQHAAFSTMKAEIFDLLLADDKVNVDDVDKNGRTALHYAARISNVVAVQKLLDNGASPNIFDKSGDSPLHVAAQERDGNTIIDLLLKAKKGMGDVNYSNKEGRAALHCAAMESNEITAEHLIQKGAELNHRDNDGITPLDVALILAKDMQIIDLFLLNMKEGGIEQYRNNKRLFFFANLNKLGLGVEIVDRLLKKGIQPPSTETDEVTEESDEAKASVNARRFEEEGGDPLMYFLKYKDFEFSIAEVKYLLATDKILKHENFDINGRDQDGQTLLFFAIRDNNVDLVKRVLEIGADPTIRDNRKGFTPFLLTVLLNKDPGILNLLLESGKVDINETTKSGMTALYMAVMDSNTPTAEFLLTHGANPNVAIKDGCTPLHVAAAYAKDLDIVELLLNHPDVDVNCLNNEGCNALDYAMNNKRGHGEAIVNLLKEHDVVGRDNILPKGNKESIKKQMLDYSNRKPDEIENCVSDDTITTGDKIARISESPKYLVSAIKNSNVETLRVLLKNGADTKTWGEYGMSALHLASFLAKTTDVIDVIYETGKFDINGGDDNNGWTPLHHAIAGTINYETNTRHLIGKGADPTIRDNDGDTSFHMAAQQHLTDTDIFGLLLENEKKIEIDGRNKKGRTALHLAIRNSNSAAAKFLLSNGANPNAADQSGFTPLHVAAIYAKDMDIVELLVNHKDTNVDYLDNEGNNALHYAMDNENGLAEEIVNLLWGKICCREVRRK
jgi:ankyrin repeat protein